MKKINTILYVTLLLISASILMGFYLYVFDANPPSEVFNAPIPVDKPSYHHGDAVWGTLNYCRYTTVPHIRHIAFTNNLIFYVPPEEVVGLPFGCSIKEVKLVTIPDELPFGRYKLVVRNEYPVNFLVTRFTEVSSVEFNIVP